MPDIHQLLGNTDIYLIDQIMKGRYALPGRILDAGAGAGRNLHWFVRQGFEVYGTDRDSVAVSALKQHYPEVPADHFLIAAVEALPFTDDYFQHVISSAVLHFADNQAHFERMFGEMIRVLKPGGSLFVRVASDVGLVDNLISLGNGQFHLPDGSDRFLLTRSLLETMLMQQQLSMLEPFKTVLVDEMRSMAVLVFQKK